MTFDDKKMRSIDHFGGIIKKDEKHHPSCQTKIEANS